MEQKNSEPECFGWLGGFESLFTVCPCASNSSQSTWNISLKVGVVDHQILLGHFSLFVGRSLSQLQRFSTKMNIIEVFIFLSLVKSNETVIGDPLLVL